MRHAADVCFRNLHSAFCNFHSALQLRLDAADKSLIQIRLFVRVPCPTLAWACRAIANGAIQPTDMPTQAWDMAPLNIRVNDTENGQVIFVRRSLA